MAYNDGIQLARIERECFIELFRFLTVTLEQTAFEQKFFAVHFEQIHRAGGGAGRAEEMDFHGDRLLRDDELSRRDKCPEKWRERRGSNP